MISRKEQLQQWRAERERRQKLELQSKQESLQKKPTTRVGNERDFQKETFSFSQNKSSWVGNQSKPFPNKENVAFNIPETNTGQKKVYSKTPAAVHATAYLNPGAHGNMTPTRLVFNSARKNQGRISCKAIKERLIVQSAQKEKRLNELRKAAAINSSIKITRPALNDSGKKFVAEASLSDEEIRFNNLKRTVRTQVIATNEFIKNGSLEQARKDLRILVEEIPLSIECGEFWLTLAGIEKKTRGNDGVATAYALAFNSLSRPEEIKMVVDSCKDFLWSNLKLEEINSVHEMLLKPKKKKSSYLASKADRNTIFKETGGLEDYLPQVKVKEEVEEADGVDNSDVNDDFGNASFASAPSPVATKIETEGGKNNLAKLSAEKFKKSFLKVKPERVASAKSSRRAPFRTDRPATIKIEDDAELGSVVVLSAVNAKPSLAAELGTTKVMTPVRRAARLRVKSNPSKESSDVLKSAGYAYTPNKALLFDDGTDTPRPFRNSQAKPRSRSKNTVTPEQIRQELEKLLI